jgi:hypothetical protein
MSQKAAAFWLTIFVNVSIVAGRSRNWAGCPLAVSRRPMLIHTGHAMLHVYAVALKSRFQSGMVGARHGHGLVCVNPTRPHYVNQMGKLNNTTWARRGAARHGVCVCVRARVCVCVCVN